ncbi:MAG: inorganic phosphate transporter [Bacteroidales bacterium]|nr:inorganic phosphate transporter [Bacteroidales bacterium]
MSFYLLAVIALMLIAILDLTVGVANDAVNFLAPAHGSRIARFKTLLFAASLGVLIGALFSGGMLDVARSGAFHPEKFSFHEIILIYFAVVVVDIILLDLFNTAGLPTSTTVSLVFELVGAGFTMALIKLHQTGSSFAEITTYVNEDKTLAMFSAILISVPLAFVTGWIIQYFSRIIFTFLYDKKIVIGAFFSGISVAFISYFIFVKGLKNAFFLTPDVKAWILDNLWYLGFGLVLLVMLSLIFIRSIRPNFNIYKPAVLYGTFAVAMAFAGNDLVNFIGPSVSAFESYLYFSESGLSPDECKMDILLHAQNDYLPYILVLAGVIMMVTLWVNKKLLNVLETSTHLSDQEEVGVEKFQANAFSRSVIRFFIILGKFFNNLIPSSVRRWIDSRFVRDHMPATEANFDSIRALITTMVGSSLIALGTSLKLPLSTTYVTFMVAMGAALGDRAWSQETAVYRVSGVFSVIGGWFLTAFLAFIFTSIVVLFLYYTEWIGMLAMLFLVGFVLIRTKFIYKEISEKKENDKELIKRSRNANTVEFVQLLRGHMFSLVDSMKEIFHDIRSGIVTEKMKSFKQARKKFKVLDKRSELFINAVNLHISENPQIEQEEVFLNVATIQREITVSLGFILNALYKHFDNHHKNFSRAQIEDINLIISKFDELFSLFEKFLSSSFSNELSDNFSYKLTEISRILEEVKRKQLDRVKKKNASSRTNLLFFNNLSEYENIVRLLTNLAMCRTKMSQYF